VADASVATRFGRDREALVGPRHQNLVGIHDLLVDGPNLAIIVDLMTGGDARTALCESGPRLFAGPAPPRDGDAAPGTLPRAECAMVPFHCRQEQPADLRSWATDSAGFSARPGPAAASGHFPTAPGGHELVDPRLLEALRGIAVDGERFPRRPPTTE